MQKRSLKFGLKGFSFTALFAVLTLFTASCGNEDVFTNIGKTEYFTQNYNPEYIEVLWVVDTRSQMSYYSSARQSLVDQARNFFVRLDGVASRQYKMAFVNMDTTNTSPAGRLQPTYYPYPLYKNQGTIAERANQFRTLFGDTLNLNVGGLNQGFASAGAALTSSFVPTANVPLVMVFISSTNDWTNSSGDAVETFATQYLAAKQNRSDLLRVYSINYTDTGTRCFGTPTNSYDQPGTAHRYSRLADRLGGAKGDICGSWADTIDLSGLRLQTLPKRFKLAGTPRDGSIRVSVVSATQSYGNLNFTYDSATNEVVFDAAPPEGSTVQVTYYPL